MGQYTTVNDFQLRVESLQFRLSLPVTRSAYYLFISVNINLAFKGE